MSLILPGHYGNNKMIRTPNGKIGRCHIPTNTCYNCTGEVPICYSCSISGASVCTPYLGTTYSFNPNMTLLLKNNVWGTTCSFYPTLPPFIAGKYKACFPAQPWHCSPPCFGTFSCDDLGIFSDTGAFTWIVGSIDGGDAPRDLRVACWYLDANLFYYTWCHSVTPRELYQGVFFVCRMHTIRELWNSAYEYFYWDSSYGMQMLQIFSGQAYIIYADTSDDCRNRGDCYPFQSIYPECEEINTIPAIASMACGDNGEFLWPITPYANLSSGMAITTGGKCVVTGLGCGGSIWVYSCAQASYGGKVAMRILLETDASFEDIWSGTVSFTYTKNSITKTGSSDITDKYVMLVSDIDVADAVGTEFLVTDIQTVSYTYNPDKNNCDGVAY